MSESNKQQAVNKLTEIVANFTAMISTRMPDDVVDKLKQLKDAETSSMGKIIYHTMFDNMQKAIDLNRPACQDTGEIMFFVKVGSRFPLLGELQSILKQAVEEATVKAPLRHNAVEIFDEVNTGKNTGSGVPWVTWDIIPDNDDAEIEVYMAGGGCTLPGRSKVLMPSEGYEGVIWYTQGFLIRPAVVQHQMIVPAGERHAFSGAIVGIQFKLHRINSAKPVAPLLLLAHGVYRRAEQCRTEKECGTYLQHRESLLLFCKRKMALC